MAQRLQRHDRSVLSRTMDIAERCNFKLEKVAIPSRSSTSRQATPSTATSSTSAARDSRSASKLCASSQTQGRLKQPLADYEQRLSREIDIIQQMKFSGLLPYRLGLHHVTRSEHSIPVGPGRGSAAGSLVAYAMQITDIDPLQNELLFERFLNPERVSLPDIDVDFCMNRRGEVIEYVTRKYGREQVAQIITFGTMAAQGRDQGRGPRHGHAVQRSRSHREDDPDHAEHHPGQSARRIRRRCRRLTTTSRRSAS